MRRSEEYVSPQSFKALLDAATGERSLSEFLGRKPQVLYWSLCRIGGHTRYVFREFPIGNSYVADFAVLNSYSGVWEVKFVELEPVDEPLFTKSGVAAKRLNGAIKQVEDWADYFDMHKAQVRADLVRWAGDKDLLRYSDGNRPSNFSGHLLADPSTNLHESFHIFIGRRDNLTEAEHKRKGQMTRRHNVEVASYDRLLDVVSERYRNSEYWLAPDDEQ